VRKYDFDGQWKNELTGENIGGEIRDDTRPFMFRDSSFNNCYPGTRSLAYYATSSSTNPNQYYCGEIKPRAVSFHCTLTSGGGNNALRDGAYNPANPAAGGTNLNGLGDGSIAGNQFPLSAKHAGSIALDFRTRAFGQYEFFANADVSYTDERPVQVHNEAFVPSTTLVGARLGFSSNQWIFADYGRNLTDEDPVAVATRWFTQPYIGFSAAPIPGTTPLASTAQLAAAGLPAYPPATGSSAGLNSVASYALSRGFFAMLRRERQLGLDMAFTF